MSRISLKSRRSVRLALVGVAIVGIAGLTAAVPHSGADFSAQGNGTVSVNTATLNIGLGNTSAADQGTFALSYGNLQPGQMVSKTFYVKNTGSINANASLGNPVPQGSLPSGVDYADLTVSVNGATPVAATSLPPSFALGQVNAGQTKAVTIVIGLSHNAGNEWQGKSVNVGATVALTQIN